MGAIEIVGFALLTAICAPYAIASWAESLREAKAEREAFIASLARIRGSR